jgi:hypothetical protein
MAEDHSARVGDLRSHVEALALALAVWSGRDDTQAQPVARQAANDAVTTIGGLLRDLHTIRRRLIGEIHASDTASAARVDVLLGEVETD